MYMYSKFRIFMQFNISAVYMILSNITELNIGQQLPRKYNGDAQTMLT